MCNRNNSKATYTIQAGLIESSGILIQQIFQETAEKCLDKYETTKNGKTNNKKKPKKWFDQVCVNLRKKVKMSANKKHALPNQLNINQHKDCTKGI